MVEYPLTIPYKQFTDIQQISLNNTVAYIEL